MDAESAQFPGDQRDGLAIEAGGKSDVTAAVEPGQEGGRDRRHARCAGQGGFRLFERGDLGGELNGVGVAVAPYTNPEVSCW